MDPIPTTRNDAALLRRLCSSLSTAHVALAVAGSGALVGLPPAVPGLADGVAHAATDPAAAAADPLPPPPDPAPAGEAPAPTTTTEQPPPASAPPAPASPATAPAAPPPPAAAAPAPPAAAPQAGAPAPWQGAPQFDLPVAGALPDAAPRSPSPRRAQPQPRPADTRAPERSAPPPAADADADTAPAEPAAARPGGLLDLPPSLVPDFFIRSLEIPPFLLPIYQAAGIEYGIRWEILAAINEIETDYGRNLNISSAGALGWMQFMPSSWRTYGVDGNHDGRKDPFNPVDAIFAAARYLKAAGATTDLRRAIYAYNHAQWYVESVLMRARRVGAMPDDLVDALSGLSQGYLPVAARARYGGDDDRAVRRPRGIAAHADPGSAAVAVQDGEIVRVGRSRRLGRFVMLRDVYGNTYTYGRLKTVAAQVPVPQEHRRTTAGDDPRPAVAPAPADPPPTGPASEGSHDEPPARPEPPAPAAAPAVAEPAAAPEPATGAKERLFAHPGRPRSLRAGGRLQILQSWTPLPLSASLRSYLTGPSGVRRGDVVLKRLVPGRRIIAGTVLGRIGTNAGGTSPHMRFEIRPAGRGAPRIDPLPIVRGWRLLDATAIHRGRAWSTLAGDPVAPTPGQIVLMSKQALARRVLANPAIDVYGCGRRDIRVGAVDRRVLATLELLAASGLSPTVSSLRCGHGRRTATGSVSAHASGSAVDITKVNGIPILGHQGPGSIADTTVRRLLTLQGALAPAEIISLMSYEGSASTLALADHADHIHVGFSTASDARTDGSIATGGLRPSQWTKLIDRVGAIRNPKVSVAPSRYAIRVTRAPARPG